jgi:hypothetical protein
VERVRESLTDYYGDIPSVAMIEQQALDLRLLLALIEKYEEALKPFAAVQDWLNLDTRGDQSMCSPTTITVGDFRRARAASALVRGER